LRNGLRVNVLMRAVAPGFEVALASLINLTNQW
jgi:hypothetical protein